MTIQAPAQQAREQQQDALNVSAAEHYDITNNPNNVTPPAFQMQGYLDKMNEYKAGYPQVSPPSEEEIQKTMWLSSGLMGLLGALVSGNAAGGIACGMSAALAVHDHGFQLRQRGQYTHQLWEEGYTAPAIMAWYNTGDTKELDKERDAMEKKREFDLSRQDQKDQFAAQEHDKLLDREQRAGEFAAGQAMQRAQLGEQHRHNAAMENNATNQSNRQELANQRLTYQEVKKGLEPEQTKLYYMGMADKALGNLESAVKAGDANAAASAYTQYRDNYARAMLGGGATLNEHDIEGATALPAWKDQMAQNASMFTTGLPSGNWVKAQRTGITNEIANAHGNLLRQGHAIYESQLQQGYSPEQAMKYTTGVMQGVALGKQDWSGVGGEGAGRGAEQQNAEKYPEAPKIGTVEEGHKYKGGDPASKDSWEAV